MAPHWKNDSINPRNRKVQQMRYRMLCYFSIVLAAAILLPGCTMPQAAPTLMPTLEAVASATASPGPGGTCPPPATPVPSQTPTITPTPGSSPTPRVFEPPPSCGGWDENGHILYINNLYWPELNPASQYDLYIMNGNGCYPRLMLTGVSGSPA